MRTSCPPRSYCSSLSDESERQSFLSELERTIVQLNLHSPSTIFCSSKILTSNSDPFDRDEQPMQTKFLSLEQFVVQFCVQLGELLARDCTLSDRRRQSLRLAIGQLLQLMRPNDLDMLKQTTGGETQSTLETFFARTSKALIVIVQEICSSLDQLIRNCSFTDSEKRLRLVRRVVSVAEIFSNFFHSLPPTRNSHALWHCFRPLLAFADRVDRFRMLSDSSLSELKATYMTKTGADLQIQTNLLTAFEHLQSMPMRSNKKSMRRLIEQLLLIDDGRSSSVRLVQHYALLLELIRVRWTFDEHLSDSTRQTLQSNVAISRQFIDECERKYSALDLNRNLTRVIKETIAILPIESHPACEQFCKAKHQLRTDTERYAELQRRVIALQTQTTSSNDDDDDE